MSKKSSKSTVARRREKVQKEQARQNRIITIGAGVLVVVVAAIIGYLIFTNLRSGESDTAGNGDVVTSEGTEMISDRPLADIPPAERVNNYSAYPEFVIDLGNDYEALIETSKGDIRMDLFVPQAPQTVNSFVYLANQGYYDGVLFHRVLEDFMAQGGDPSGTGSGGPGYVFEDEVDSGLEFDRPGLLAMANSGPGTNGSQFFITFVPTPHLNGRHTIFGEVIEGSEVLDELTRVDPQQPNQPQPDIIEKVTIFEIEGQ